MKPRIKILDSVHCVADRALRADIYDLLTYKIKSYRPAQYGMKSTNKVQSFLDKRNGVFLTGLLPMVVGRLAKKKVKFSLEGEYHKLPFLPYSIPTIKLRSYQSKALEEIAHNQRGVILSPTGSGKTVVIMAAANIFRDYKQLVLCHTKDLLTQTSEELEKHLPDLRPQIIGGGRSKEIDRKANIIVSTVQSFSKIPPDEYMDYFDVIQVDEAHHCNSRKCQFGFIVQRSLAPVKIGYTATLPESKRARLALEGLIGPMIYELPIKEGVKMKVLAKPKVTLIPIPNRPIDAKKYRDIYKIGVVLNRYRNGRIVMETAKRVAQGKSVLIMVKEIEHGIHINELLNKARVDNVFVHGATEAKARNATKEALIRKATPVVISTAIWREGINIPTLDCVINACGGKSEIMTLQAIGRGLRTTKKKSKVEIIDIIDPYRYLAEHSVARMSTYYKQGWIK